MARRSCSFSLASGLLVALAVVSLLAGWDLVGLHGWVWLVLCVPEVLLIGQLYRAARVGDHEGAHHRLQLKQVVSLMADEDVTKKRGIYSYVLDGQEKHLNIRAFSPNQRREAYERQKGLCAVCGNHFELEEMEADHITPWHAGGKTEAANCKMLCRDDNRKKGGV